MTVWWRPGISCSSRLVLRATPILMPYIIVDERDGFVWDRGISICRWLWHSGDMTRWKFIISCERKGKERKLDLYSAPLWEARLCSAQAWSHSFYAATTPYLSLPRKAFTRRRYNDSDNSRLIAAHYSFIIDPERMKGWVGLVGWSTFSGRFTFTHINGYPSAAGTLQARESWPVRNRRSTTQLHRQPCNLT